jgi:hypothetical protein
MSIEQISPNSTVADPAHLNPQVKAEHAAAMPLPDHDVENTVKSIKTDTVTISPQAVQKLANERDSAAEEVKEKAGNESSERQKGQQ